jgi:transcriptional regulator with XRE-family HTH domain
MQLQERHNSPSMKIDGTKLRRLREENFITREELATMTGLHYDSIGRLERGDWPSGSQIRTIRKLADALGVHPSEIVEDRHPRS